MEEVSNPKSIPEGARKLELDEFRTSYALRLKPAELIGNGRARLRYLPDGEGDFGIEVGVVFENVSELRPIPTWQIERTFLRITPESPDIPDFEGRMDDDGWLARHDGMRKGYLVRDEDSQDSDLIDPPTEGTERAMAELSGA